MGRVLCRRDIFPGKKGGKQVGKTKRGKGTKLMVVADGEGVPLGILTDSASPHEVTLIEKTIDEIVLPGKQPERLIYDRAADSDKLRDAFQQRGIELICPHRRNRKKTKRQDGRKLRRYTRRWKIERTIGWLHNFRRIVVRYERNIKMYSAFIHVACLMITLRKL